MLEKNEKIIIPEERDFAKEFRELDIIIQALLSLGMDVCFYPEERVRDIFIERCTVPIVNDGAQGIRITNGNLL